MYQRCGAPCDLGKNDQAKRQYTVPRSKRKIWGKKYIICFTFHFEKKYFNSDNILHITQYYIYRKFLNAI